MIPTPPPAPQTDPAAPPPGWYPADNGFLRWWDGAGWGPYAPAPTPQTEEERGKTMATLAHLGFVAGGVILPLILYLIERNKPDRNRFVCHHACEALNFQIAFMLVWVLPFVGMFVAVPFLDSADDTAGAGFAIGFFAIWGVMMLTMLANYVLSIIAMVKASRGEWWRYPVSLRLVGRRADWRTG